MPFLESKWLNDLEDHGANWVILAQICDELPHGKTEFPRILESKWPKLPWMSKSMTPICNNNREDPMMHVWCKFGCSSSYMWRVIRQTMWSLRTDGRTGHWLLFGNFWIHCNEGQRLISTLHLKQCLCAISRYYFVIIDNASSCLTRAKRIRTNQSARIGAILIFTSFHQWGGSRQLTFTLSRINRWLNSRGRDMQVSRKWFRMIA